MLLPASLEAHICPTFETKSLKSSSPSQVSIPALQDPLLEAIQRKFVETGIVKQCETGTLMIGVPRKHFLAPSSGQQALTRSVSFPQAGCARPER